MQIIKVNPRALKANPDRMRQTKSSLQADALMLATIKAVGIVLAGETEQSLCLYQWAPWKRSRWKTSGCGPFRRCG